MGNIKQKINCLLNDIDKYENYSLKENIEERLEKVLKKYLIELEESYLRLKCKKKETVFKELSK